MDTDNPRQPSPSFRPNRRVCPSDLKQTIKALKRALRKEEKRADKMAELRRQIDELAGKVRALRDPG
jgi:hypothetical protein